MYIYTCINIYIYIILFAIHTYVHTSIKSKHSSLLSATTNPLILLCLKTYGGQEKGVQSSPVIHVFY